MNRNRKSIGETQSIRLICALSMNNALGFKIEKQTHKAKIPPMGNRRSKRRHMPSPERRRCFLIFLPASENSLSLLGSVVCWTDAALYPHAASSDGHTPIDARKEVMMWCCSRVFWGAARRQPGLATGCNDLFRHRRWSRL